MNNLLDKLIFITFLPFELMLRFKSKYIRLLLLFLILPIQLLWVLPFLPILTLYVFVDMILEFINL